MLLSQKIELAIYKRIKALGPWAVTMDLPMLFQATGADHATIIERLKGLVAGRRIGLLKYSGGSRWPRADFNDNDRKFFYEGAFLIEVVPEGESTLKSLNY